AASTVRLRSKGTSAQRVPYGGLHLLAEHVVGQRGFGVGDAQLLGTLVRHREQPSDPPGDRILGQGGIVQLSELLEARLLVLDAPRTRPLPLVGNLGT